MSECKHDWYVEDRGSLYTYTEFIRCDDCGKSIELQEIPKYIKGLELRLDNQIKQKHELKARVAELEHGTIKITWEPKQFEKLVEHGRMLLIKTKGKTPIELRVASSADDDKYIFDLKASQQARAELLDKFGDKEAGK